MTSPAIRQPDAFVLANDDAPAYWQDGALEQVFVDRLRDPHMQTWVRTPTLLSNEG